MMKRTIYLLASVLFLVWGCEPMEDTYEELDKAEGVFSKNIEVTLEEGDYSSISDIALKLGDEDAADFIDENHAFSEDALAADYVPGFLGNEYIALKKDSRAKVTFNYLTGYPDYVSDYMLNYELTTSDYISVDPSLEYADAFTPSFPAEESRISEILSNQYPDKSDGALAYVSYRVSDIDLEATPELFLEAHFNGSFGDFEAYSLEGEQEWELDDYDDDEYAIISGFSGGANANNDWLVSPEIDLTGQSSAYITIRQAVNYLGDWNNLKIMVSTDYSGNVEAATWNEISFSQKPEGDSWDFVESEAVDISDYTGETVHIAFNYNSTTESSATWEVDWLKVSKTPVPNYSYFSEIYVNNEGWKKKEEGDDFEDDVYLMQPEDYDDMGAPGNYDNFSDSDDPDDYLPQFISLNLPYAQEDDHVVVSYMYYAGSTSLKASEYVFNGTTWENTSKIVERTEQFVHNGEKWVFDPTVVFTMSSDDYQLIVDYVQSNIENGASYLDSYGTTEYYYGASSYFENFDLRLSQKEEYEVPGYDGLSTEEAIKLSYDRMTEAVEIMLKEKYPDAVPTVNGVDVHYIVSVETYEDDLSRGHYEYDFKCVSAGPDPEFELISAPDFGGE